MYHLIELNTVKYEIKKQEVASLVQPAISSVVKGISGRGVMNKNF